MAPGDIISALDASRRFEADSAGARFTLQLPSEHAWRVAMQSHRDAQGRTISAKAMRQIAEEATLGWSGVTLGHLVPDGGAEQVPFSREALALLLEHRQDICDELAVELGRRTSERRERLEGARKNSERASTGS